MVESASLRQPTTGAERLNRRWDLVVIGIIVYTCLGTIYSWSVFRTPLEAALGLTPAQSGLPYSTFLATFAFSMPLAGAAVQRLGTRPILLLGGVLVGIGWVGAGLAGGSATLIAMYGLFGGLGVGLAYGVPLVVVSDWFPQRRGLAMGLTLAGFGVSPFVTARVAEVLIGRLGVRTAMIALGVSFVVVVAAFVPWFKLRVVSNGAATAAGHSDAPSMDLSPRRMLRSARFYALWICFAIGTLSGLTAIGMTASFAQRIVGLSASAAAATVAAFGVLNGIGRPIFGSVHDRLGPRATLIAAHALVAVGAAVAAGAENGGTTSFFIGFGVLWLMLGGWLAIAPAATMELFGARHYARNYGIMYTAYGVGALAGGGIAAGVYRSTGSYRALFVAILVLCAVGIAFAAVAFGKRRAG